MSAEVSAPALQVGDWLDVIDGDGIWNVAQVLRLPSAETVEVTYDCWGDEYNEELRRDSARIAPFHTHTWAVKCWAKLATWPWWPALLTVRAPGSDEGSQNLRLEGRLLVDFLDSAEFTERCRCWVKKSKIVAFQSDEETRKRLKKFKKKRKKSKTEARSKNLALSTTLLTKCDAREDFPEFVEGTLPVQFEHNFTRPTEEVRKEMWEEIWMRGLADNRVNHAATHAYTPIIANGNGIEPSKSAEETGTSKSRARDASQNQEESSSSPDTGAVDKAIGSALKKPKDVATRPEKNKTTTQKPKNPRKRARPSVEDETTDTSRDKASPPRKQTQETHTKHLQLQAANNSVDDKCREEKTVENVMEPNTGTEELRVASRKYGKTPKVLKAPKRSATNLPLYTPPYARVLLRVKPRNEQHTARSSHARATQARQRVKKGVPDKELSASDHRVQQTNAAVRRSTSSELKPGDEIASPMKSLARLTKATLRADEKLHNMETALESKLTELAEKSAKAEELRSKCAALPTRVRSPKSVPASKTEQEDLPRGSSRGRSPTPDAASEIQSINRDGSQRGNDSPDASRVPTLAKRSSQAECGIRGLELTLDAVISKQQGQNLSAATTPAELDAIKADLLSSPEVQAAITRLQSPSYGWATPTGISSRGTSSLSNCGSRRALEEAKSRYPKYHSGTGPSERRPLPRSPSQQFGRSWGYERESKAGAERLQGPSSRLLDPPPADYSSFGFSVNDNFSMNQWYRDLYPKAFGFQRPWR